MADPHQPPPGNETKRSAADRHLAPFFEDSALWPVVIVIAAVGVTLLGALLFAAAFDRNWFALAASLGLFWMSFDWVWRERRTGRFGTISRCLAVLWLLSTFAAGLAGWLAAG